MSILLEMLDESGLGQSKLDLETLDEFKQLPSELQLLIKDKQIQHARTKELNTLAQQKRMDEMLLARRGKRRIGFDEATENGPFVLYDENNNSSQSGFNLNEDDVDSFSMNARMRRDLMRSRLNGLVPGAPAQTPTQYLSSSNLSLDGLGVMHAAPRVPPLNRLDELIALAHPLIVLDGHLLENSFNQLKEIIGAETTTTSDEQLVKLLIRHDCDLNRVVPIVLNFE